MEDIILSGDLRNVKKNSYSLSLLKNVDKNTDSTSSSSIEEVDKTVISDDFQQKAKNSQTAIIDVQELQNTISTAEQGLSSIGDILGKIKKQKDNITDDNIDESAKEIDEQLEEIKKVVEDTKFNDKKPLKEDVSVDAKLQDAVKSSQLDLKAPETPEKSSIETEKERAEFFKQIEKASEEAKAKQQAAMEAEYKLVTEVSSTIELNPELSEIDVELSGKDDFEIQKEETRKEIINKPEESIKAQIRQLDESMIIALISI